MDWLGGSPADGTEHSACRPTEATGQLPSADSAREPGNRSASQRRLLGSSETGPPGLQAAARASALAGWCRDRYNRAISQNKVDEQSIGRHLLTGVARTLVVVGKRSALGVVVEIADEWWQTWKRICAEKRLSALEQAKGIEELSAIPVAEAILIAEEVLDAEELPPSAADDVRRIVQVTPAHVGQAVTATLEMAQKTGTSPACALPLDETVHPGPSKEAFIRGLVPGLPRFQANQRVPHRPGWSFTSLLGKGGFGEVWLVSNPFVGQQAMKFCLETTAGELLKREARNLAELRRGAAGHPNIVDILDVNVSEEPYMIALQHVGGGTLKDLIRAQGGPMPQSEALGLWKQVCSGVAAAHALGICHRDLKPANILLDENGTAKVADFGIGKALSESTDALTGELTLAGFGTDIYSAPEQRHSQAADPADDVYSLGVLLFQMLVGSVTATPPRRLERALTNLDPPPMPWLVSLIEDCLDERSHRPADASALLAKIALEDQDAAALAPPSTRFATSADVTETPETLIERYRQAAEQGDAEAMFQVACLHETSNGVVEDPVKAAEWYRKAAEAGHRDSMYAIAECYAKGAGVTKNQVKAAEWYGNAASQGHSRAMYRLALCYADGTGLTMNATRAVEWHQKAAEAGDANAMFALGVHLQYPDAEEGTEEDPSRAVEWYRKAATLGNADAMFALGDAYTEGLGGLEEDQAEAVRWYRKAAEGGDATAMYALGLRYLSGRGIDQSESEAVRWFRKAADAGNVSARRELQGYE